MRRTLSSLAVFCALAGNLAAQEPSESVMAPGAVVSPDDPATAELVHAVADNAAIFSRSGPGLVAQEVLHQRGRRGSISASGQNPGSDTAKNLQTEDVTATLPPDFHTHDVVSAYALGEIGASRAVHEIRSIFTIDGRVISAKDAARHALALGIQSPDDDLKRRLLENFERNRLEGAVTDFGQLVLLFTGAGQKNYIFTRGHNRLLNGVPMIALEYKQISGGTGLTVFHERTVEVRSTEGEIWLRRSDLLLLRITMFTQAPLGKNLTMRNAAVVDYTPTEFGLAPKHVSYMQFLGPDLLVENDFQYSDYQRLTPGIVP